MPDISGLYPQPQQQTQGALGGDPLRLIGALGGINQAMLFAKTFQARQALGDAWSKNLQPDGTPNLAGVAQDLKNNPNANFLLPEATSNILEQRGKILEQHGKMIANDTASFDQYAKQSDFVQQWLARRATQPNVTSEDVLNDLVTLSRNTDPRVLPSSVLNSVGSSILSDPKGVRTGIVNLANRVRGAASATAPVQGPPGAGGATTTIPGGAGLYPPAPGAKAAPTIPGQVTTGLAKGEEIPLTGSATAAKNLEDTASTSNLYHANLENLKQDSRVLGNLGGPTMQTEMALNALSQRVAGFGVTMTPAQMRAAGSFGKIVNQISLGQGSLLGDTDAARSMTLHANPNVEMPQATRDGLIDMLQGNQDAVDVTRKLWLDAKRRGAPANSHYEFLQTFANEPLNSTTGAKFDPRVFQFNRMADDNRQQFLNQMDPKSLTQFESNYKEAIKRGWVASPQKKPSGNE